MNIKKRTFNNYLQWTVLVFYQEIIIGFWNYVKFFWNVRDIFITLKHNNGNFNKHLNERYIVNQIKDKLKNNNSLPDSEKIEMLLLIKTGLDQNYFRFQDNFYIQVDGLPMGLPLSALLSEIFMSKFEEKTDSKW